MYRKSITRLVGLSFLLLGLSGAAGATLTVEGTVDYKGEARNLIYDNDLNITWLDYSSGEKNWENQKEWANNQISFTIGSTIYNNWRLPNIDELTHLFLDDGAWLKPISPFDNLLFSSYWSSSTYKILGTELYLIGGLDPAYGASFWTNTEHDNYQGIAVIDGRISQTTSVPEPTTMLLFCTGIASLAVLRRAF